MAEKLLASEVPAFIARTLDGVEGLPAGESHWMNGEVVELLEIILDALRNPEWAQVVVEEIIGQRDLARAQVHALQLDNELALVIWDSLVDQLTEERDRARNIAVAFEQEIARMEGSR